MVGIDTERAILPASVAISLSVRRPISGTPRQADTAAPETYAISKPARSICIATSALNAPGMARVRVLSNSRKRDVFVRVAESLSVFVIYPPVLNSDPQERHECANVPDTIKVPYEFDKPVDAGAIQPSGG